VTVTPIATQSEVNRGEGEAQEDESNGSNTGWLIASILIMVLVISLFCYLMYLESDRIHMESEKSHAILGDTGKQNAGTQNKEE
jgi:uncharacterized membrane protein